MADTTFETSAGFLLTAAFTDASAAQARAELGLDLAALARLRPRQFVARVERTLRARDGRVFGLLYTAVQDQLDARGVSPERFAALIPHTHVAAALVALMGAIAARFPYSPLARGLAAAKE